MMEKRLTLIFLLFICLCVDSAYARQTLTDLTIQADGNAPVVKNDVAAAREKAVKNALERAIMQAMTGCLPDKFDDEKFQAVKSIMTGGVERYVKNYRMISERTEQEVCTVSLNVVMAAALVRNDLLQMGFLQEQGKKEGASVALSLKGMKKYSDFAGVKAFLQGHSEMVKSFYPCRLGWQQAHFDLMVAGSLQSFLVELENSGRYAVETRHKNQDIVEIYLQVKEEVR
jgi:hypothetical protein